MSDKEIIQKWIKDSRFKIEDWFSISPWTIHGFYTFRQIMPIAVAEKCSLETGIPIERIPHMYTSLPTWASGMYKEKNPSKKTADEILRIRSIAQQYPDMEAKDIQEMLGISKTKLYWLTGRA